MKRLLLTTSLALVAFSAHADWSPQFLWGAWSYQVSRNGQTLDVQQFPVTYPYYRYNSIPYPGSPNPASRINIAIDDVFSGIKGVLDSKASEAIQAEGGSFYGGSLTAPFQIGVIGYPSSSYRVINFSGISYDFSFKATGWAGPFHFECWVNANASNIAFQLGFNSATGVVDSSATNVSFSSPTVRNVNCNLIGVDWASAIAKIIKRWITPGPGDLGLFASSAGPASMSLVSETVAAPSLNALGPRMSNVSSLAMTVWKYRAPVATQGVSEPRMDYTWNILSLTAVLLGDSSLYTAQVSRAESWYWVWYCPWGRNCGQQP